MSIGDDSANSVNPFGALLKNARRVHEQMEKTRKEFSATEVVGEAGDGLVRIVLVGGKKVRRVELDDSLLADGGMLRDLIAAAVTDALQKTESALGEKMHSTFADAMDEK